MLPGFGDSSGPRSMLVKVHGEPIGPRSIGVVALQERDWTDRLSSGSRKPVFWKVANDSDRTLAVGTRGYALLIAGDWRFVRP